MAGASALAGVSGCLNFGYPTHAGVERAQPAQFRGGLRRRGYRDVQIPETVEIAWTVPGVNTGGHTAAKASAVEAPDGSILVPGDSGYVWSVRPDSEVRWRTRVTHAARGVHGTPAVAGGLVYVGAYDGAFSALDVETGERVWRVDLGDAIGSSPAYHDGTVYVAVEYLEPSGSVFALEATTGVTEWVDDRPTDHPHSTIAIDREVGRLVVGANDGNLYAWTYPALEFAWSYPTGRPIKGPVATDGDAAYVGSWDHHVHAVDMETGETDWTFETDSYVMSGASVVEGTVYVGSHDGNLYALDAATGQRRWLFETDGRIIGCPTVTPGHVLVGSYDTSLYCVTREGEPVWRIENRGRVTSTPLVTENGIFYTERTPTVGEDGVTGHLYALKAN